MNLHPCKIARSHFSDHLDGEPVPPLARFLVRLHLTICPPCKRAHRSLVATRDALRALRDADIDLSQVDPDLSQVDPNPADQ